MKALLIVEDDQDVQLLIETIFSIDSRFSLAGSVDTAEQAFDLARTTAPEIIVLDHSLAGAMTGFAAVRRFREVAPEAKIILFTAHAELQAQVDLEPNVDAFLLKTEPGRLLPLAQQLTNMLSLM